MSKVTFSLAKEEKRISLQLRQYDLEGFSRHNMKSSDSSGWRSMSPRKETASVRQR
jgi:hypothetical protein